MLHKLKQMDSSKIKMYTNPCLENLKMYVNFHRTILMASELKKTALPSVTYFDFVLFSSSHLGMTSAIGPFRDGNNRIRNNEEKSRHA